MLEADRGQTAITIHIVDSTGYENWLLAQPENVRIVLSAQRFTGASDSLAVISLSDSWSAVVGVKDAADLKTWCLARAAELLPEGTYRLAEGVSPGPAALGWLLAHYAFDRYKPDAKPTGPRILLTADLARIESTIREAEAVTLVRDLVNTPAADMGPSELEAEAEKVAKTYNGVLTVTKGHNLETGYPMIHAVGIAADKKNAPRLIEVEWGSTTHPLVAIIGKGVVFDSGGLDIKPSSGMRNMKKDMGGAAHALALAQLIMQSRLPVRLHLLIPAVENAISGNAFRPGDILTSRKGLTVEVANTDAEGRLVLADALTKAAEGDPALIIDFATLTGAARVALGPDLPATFANDDALADAVLKSGVAEDDPLWRLPLHAGYDDMLKSEIADLNNSPDSGFAGATTAALFLQKFVAPTNPWLHLDTFAWRPSSKPGRPKGGEALGLRAVWAMLQDRFPR
ncbi:leucyl aminopeptidase family protein [Sphingomonas paeninsulae]|uniref:Leucyl aminopeptidase family protein n=1 Tax=Sphingomonas paeninsulae TaxID=2319844 RepID=A0A494TFM8_SPHPE|nr:leucyl aminopeptidase family protein [Sphingomonas paeninsulae]AYJ88130.1 leucyl aminopeptidase family protein [Sphingomonas paeninsulae]